MDNAILLAAVVETATARANLAGLDAAAEQSAAKLSIVDAAAQAATTATTGLQGGAQQAGQQLGTLGKTSGDASKEVSGTGSAARGAAGNLLEMAGSAAGANSGLGLVLTAAGALVGGGGLAALAIALVQSSGLIDTLTDKLFGSADAAIESRTQLARLAEDLVKFEGAAFEFGYVITDPRQLDSAIAHLQRSREIAERFRDNAREELSGLEAIRRNLRLDRDGATDGDSIMSDAERRRMTELRQFLTNQESQLNNIAVLYGRLEAARANFALQRQLGNVLDAAGATPVAEYDAQQQAEREAERARIRAEREAERARDRAQRFGDQQERIQADSIGRTALQAERADHERHMTRIAGIADEDQKRREGIAEEYRYAVAVAGLTRQAAERENAAANISAATRAQRNAQARTQQEADVAEAARRQAEATADLNDDIADRQARAAERQGREQEQRDREAFRARKDAADRQFDVDQQRIRQGVQAGMVAVEAEKRGIADVNERRVFEIYATEMLAREASERLLAAEEKRITATYAEGAEREQRLAVVRAENQTRLGEAEAKRVASTADLEERVGRQAFERAQRRIRQAETLAGRVASRGLDAVEAALRGTRRLSETEVEIQRDRFAEEEKALKKSLRNREIDQRRFNLEMRRLAEERADYDKRVEQERTGVLGALGRGLVDLLIDEGKRLIAGYIAQGVVRLAISLGLMKSAEAATAASMATITTAAANAATLVSIATGGAAAVTGTAGILAGMAAVKAASIVGQFESGGFTGWGGRRQVAGVVHGREFVMPADVVERDGPGPWYALMARIRAGSRLGDALGMAGVPQLYSGGYVMPAVPSEAYVPAPVYDDTRLVATGQATNARLDHLSRAVDALANRPTTYVVGDADARRQRYAAEREARRVDPRRRL